MLFGSFLREQAVRKALRQKLSSRVVKVNIVRHVVQIVVFVYGAVKIINEGNADVHSDSEYCNH